jgi:heme-degrading monooxygenase HmoA
MITLIAVFEMKAKVVKQFMTDWKTDKDFMMGEPGFGDGTFYRSSQSDASFRFVNVAHWKSDDDWKAAIEAGEKYRVAKGINRRSDWTHLGINVFPAIYNEEIRY